MNNPEIPTASEIITALNTLAQCSTQIGRQPLRDAVKLLRRNSRTEETPYLLWITNKHVMLALRSFSEAICKDHDDEIAHHLRAFEFEEAHALRLYQRANSEVMTSIDEALEVAGERYIGNVGNENPQTEDEFNSCSDHE